MFKFGSNFLRFILLLSFVVAFGAPWSFFNEAKAVKRPDFMISNKVRKSDKFDETNKYGLVVFSITINPDHKTNFLSHPQDLSVQWNRFDPATKQLLNVKRDEKDEFSVKMNWKKLKKGKINIDEKQWFIFRVIKGDYVLAQTKTQSQSTFGFYTTIHINIKAFSLGTEGFHIDRGQILYIGDYLLGANGGFARVDISLEEAKEFLANYKNVTGEPVLGRFYKTPFVCEQLEKKNRQSCDETGTPTR